MLRCIQAFVASFLLVFLCPAVVRSQTNLLTNPGFESGTAGWSNLASADISASGQHSGSSCVRLRTSKMIEQSVSVTAGRTYAYICWIKVAAFANSDWGYVDISTAGRSVNSRDVEFPANEWYKVAITFVAQGNRQTVSFGVFGPQPQIDLYFDDCALIEKSGNQPPVIAPQASTISGSVPLTVNFTANGDDADGAIAAYRWLFGDGSEAAIANPSHVYYSRGAYTVTLNAWDNDGAKTSATLTVTVSDNASPTVAITSPSSNASFATSAATAALSGTAQAGAGKQITTMSWDNVTADTAGIIAVTAGASVNWNAGNIALKPGKNEILVTAIQSDGKASTDVIVITRNVSGPAITAISANASTVRLYEKYEVTFDLATAAEKTLFQYDDNPPPGVAAGIGVTAEGVITLPDGSKKRHPCFYMEECAISESDNNGVPTAFAEPATYRGRWKLRFAPTMQGNHQVSIEARDASGSTSASVGAFTAMAPDTGRRGFIQLSKDDGRYQEYSDRTLYIPTGPAWGNNYAQYAGSGLNWERPWMGGSGMYSTNWSRWKSTGEQWGNEGAQTPLEYREHYPSSDLSYKIWLPEGRRIWMSGFCDNSFVHRFKRNSEYMIKMRLKVAHLSGPVNASYPHGFMMKPHGWPGDSLERDLRGAPSMIPVISANRDWHTMVVRYRHTSNESDFSMYLDNVSSGNVYIDQLSIREIKTDGSLGGEMIRNSRADQHTYVEQRPGAWFDWQVEQAARYGIGLEYVVQDKNDWVPNHLNENGVFSERGAGYYAREGTKARWLQKQWWRYLAARYGYSTGVRAWELCNEGPPDNGSGAHARATQEFAAYMHSIDAHRHLVSTSFWCCWEPTFWGNRATFPDVDYADIHWYPDQTNLTRDMAFFIDSAARMVGATHPGIPVQLGELGMAGTAGEALQADNDGTWYHNLLWSQLNSAGLSAPGYWHPEHMNGFDRIAVARPFGAFCRSLDVNKGGYVPLAATVTGADIRVHGQKNLASGKAHVWIQNKRHDWYNVMNNAAAIGTVSGSVKFKMSANASYSFFKYDTYTGATTAEADLRSDANGDVVITVNGLAKDVAYAIGYDPRAAIPPTAGQTFRSEMNQRLSADVSKKIIRGGLALHLSLPQKTNVSIVVFSIEGKLVRRLLDGTYDTGHYSVVWDGKDNYGVSTGQGLYVCKVNTGNTVIQLPIMIAK